LLTEVEVGFGVFPPIAGQTAPIAGADASLALPIAPLAGYVASFKLMRGRRYAPEKVWWKSEHAPSELSSTVSQFSSK
jgi:hypothetical protein